MIVEINGMQYRQKEQKQYRPSKTLSMFSIMYGMFGGGFDTFGSKRSKNPPVEINIVKEYELIQNKKSNLSASQRDSVVCQFESNFEPIPTNPLLNKED